jgi:CspA family cold shock protein
MNKGTIKTFTEDQNFGFITPEGGGKDIHFNRNAVQRDHQTKIVVGSHVEYETAPGRKPGEFTAKGVVITGAPPVQATFTQRGTPRGATGLPKEALFSETFYGEDGHLKQELFFTAPEALAGAFKGAGLKSSQFRQAYQAFLGFAGPLRDNRLSFDAARERFGVFYVERIVRQVERGILPPVVKEFMDIHRDIALSAPKEMLGLFRYLKNVYCYFGDKEKDSRN